MATVRLVLDTAALAALLRGPDARAVIDDAGREFADAARSLAPHRTGAGAASIHGDVVDGPGGPESDVTWDQEHAYMYFSEVGTEFMPAHPFMRPALDRYAQF
jgi:HK97 gp10 family phage protein